MFWFFNFEFLKKKHFSQIKFVELYNIITHPESNKKKLLFPLAMSYRKKIDTVFYFNIPSGNYKIDL